MIEKTVYLAGPIAGLTYSDARHGWRETFADMMPTHIHCLSPMRGKEALNLTSGPLSSVESAYGDLANDPMLTSRGITTRDYNDVRTCDVMVACFLESEGRPSLGTAAEFGFAWALQKPIIVVGSSGDPNVSHVMLHRMAGFHVETLETAARIARLILTPGL